MLVALSEKLPLLSDSASGESMSLVKKLPGIRVSQVIWGAYFIHGKIIEC